MGRTRTYKIAECGDCGRERKLPAKGLCSSCYNKQAREKDPELARRALEHRQKWRRNNRERTNELNKISHSRENKEQQRTRNRRHILKGYGLTLGDYDAMEEAQGNLCAICSRKPDQVLAVDHDHETGEIRGLLCRKCNSALGLFGDDPKTLEAALQYLGQSS